MEHVHQTNILLANARYFNTHTNLINQQILIYCMLGINEPTLSYSVPALSQAGMVARHSAAL